MKLFDTSVWVEYFKGSDAGLKIKKIIEENYVCTSAITLAEISKWANENKLDINNIINQIKTNSIVIKLEDDILIASGKIFVNLRKVRTKISLIDGIIYTTSLIHNMNLITKERDFINLDGVELI